MKNIFEELDNIIKVENAIGSSKAWPKPNNGYDSWIEYWEAMMCRKANKCLLTSEEDDLVGAHVLICDEKHKKNPHVYLTILCKRVNNSSDSFYMDRDDLLDVSNICPFSDIKDNY